jgi:hypothetical protein
MLLDAGGATHAITLKVLNLVAHVVEFHLGIPVEIVCPRVLVNV